MSKNVISFPVVNINFVFAPPGYNRKKLQLLPKGLIKLKKFNMTLLYYTITGIDLDF